MQYKKCVTLQYNSADFLEFLKVFFSKHPCLLCGEVHKFYNHGKIDRLIRDNQTYTNRKITIFVAFCPKNQKAGKQFTKRILPPFIIPESNITLENCLLMFQECRGTSFSYDLACQILGTYCERTVRRHYRQLTKVLKQTISWTLAWLAQHPLIAVLPGRDPGATVYEALLNMYKAILSAGQKARGTFINPPPVMWFPAYNLLLTKARRSCSVPFNLVYLIRVLFDTS